MIQLDISLRETSQTSVFQDFVSFEVFYRDTRAFNWPIIGTCVSKNVSYNKASSVSGPIRIFSAKFQEKIFSGFQFNSTFLIIIVNYWESGKQKTLFRQNQTK